MNKLGIIVAMDEELRLLHNKMTEVTDCEIGGSVYYTGKLGACDVVLDITDAGAIDAAIREIRPDALIHCAAWTAVDAAEEQEELVRTVNAKGTANLAAACKECG